MGLFSPADLSANDRAKRRRESREIREILKFQKNLKKLYPHTFSSASKGGKKSEPTKIRIRALSGSAKGKTLTLSNTSIQFLWDGWGIGQTTMKFEKSKSGKEFSILNSFNDLSYTFGDEFSLTIGTGVLGSGKGTYKESQKEFISEKACGSAYFFSIGTGIEDLKLIQLLAIVPSLLQFLPEQRHIIQKIPYQLHLTATGLQQKYL